jgi:hypothetical protein
VTRDSTGALPHRETGSRAVGHVAARGRMVCPLS